MPTVYLDSVGNARRAAKTLQWFTAGLICVLTVLFIITTLQYSRLQKEADENGFFVMLQMDRETRKLANEIETSVIYKDKSEAKLNKISLLYDILYSRIQIISSTRFDVRPMKDEPTKRMVSEITDLIKSTTPTFDKMSDRTKVSDQELSLANDQIQNVMAISEKLIPRVGNVIASDRVKDKDTLITLQLSSAIIAILSIISVTVLILLLRKQVSAIGRAKLAVEDRADNLQIEVERAVKDVRAREEEIIECLSVATGHKDTETSLHTKRVAHYSEEIALRLGLSKEEAYDIRLASLMHDIGKVGVPDHVLQKAGRLTDAEMSIMRTHTTIGSDILKESKSDLLKLAAKIAGSHHEKWDGTGYPAQLRHEGIPLAGRIVALADTFDALASIRPYKPAWALESVIEYINKEAGKHFDPSCVDAFNEALGDIVKIYEALAETPNAVAVS
jgi:putative nucleotidyltransferase with HDIG domain